MSWLHALGVAGLVLAIVGCTLGAEPTPAVVHVASASGDELAFEPPTVSGPARVPLTVEFRNTSSEVHNLVFVGALDVRSDPVVPAGGGDTLRLPALEPGDYDFVCTIHEGMTGTLTLD